MSNLYCLSTDYLEVLGKVDEWDEQTLVDTLDSIQGEITVKLIGIAQLVKMTENEAAFIREEEKRLAGRRKARENMVERLKVYAQQNMERIGVEKISHPTMPVRLQNNPPSLMIVDAKLIPNAYLTVVPAHTELNNSAIKDALKSGEEVPGAKLQRSKSLRIG